MSNQIQETPTALVLRAAKFATEAHKNQRRKAVTENLSSVGGVTDPAILAAALLHDTVEDTSVTLTDIENNFGKRIRDIVAEVSDDKSLSKVERKKLQIVHAAHASTEAKLVKLADKLANLNDLKTNPIWDLQRCRGYFVWAFKVVEGMRGTNAGLEDEIDKLFSGAWVNANGGAFSALPPMDQLEAELEQYYDGLAH